MELALICSSKPKFELGQVVTTANAEDEIQNHIDMPMLFVLPELLGRHVSGDWGEVDDHDKKANDDALKFGGRLLSVYDIMKPNDANSKLRVWVITESDRSTTTILLPSDY